MAKNRSGRLADTGVIMSRKSRAEALEREKQEIKIQLEKCMRQYARISGMDGVAERAHKVGYAPNDHKFDN